MDLHEVMKDSCTCCTPAFPGAASRIIFRRLSKDYEQLISSSVAIIAPAMMCLLTNRLAGSR